MIVSIARAALAGALAVAAPAAAQDATPAPAAPPFDPATLSAKAFAQLPFVEQARISPDGTRIAGLLGVGGVQRFAAFSLFDKTEKPFTVGVPEATQASFVRWVNDDNVLVGLTALRPFGDSGENAYLSRLVAINRKTGKITRLLWDMDGQNHSLVWVANDGSPRVLIAAQASIYLDELFWPAVYSVDVETGKRGKVQGGRDGVYDWQADAAGRLRTGTGYQDQSRSFRLLYRGESGDGGFTVLDRADSRKREALITPWLFLPGGDRALTVHDDEAGRSTIYETDLITQKDARTVLAAPAGSEIAAPILSPDGGTLLGAWTTTAGTEGAIWIDPPLAELQAALTRSVPGRSATIIDFNRDRTRMLIKVSRPDSPGALYYFDTAGGTMHRLGLYNEAIGTRTLNPNSLIKYKARDGLEIEAVLTLPRGKPAKNLPIVVMPHGGPWGQDRLGYDYWPQFVASRGYAVIQPNFRGSTGYGTPFLRAGEGELGLKMQDDVNDALAWAAKQGIADPKRACLVGASYGGYVALWGATRDPDLWRCAISVSGVGNLRREVNDFGRSLMGGKFTDDWKRMTPDFAAVSPIGAVAGVKAPILLIHGKKDITVDFRQSSAMYGKLKGAGKDVTFVSLPEADHYFTRQADREAMLGAIEAFLAKNNPAG